RRTVQPARPAARTTRAASCSFQTTRRGRQRGSDKHAANLRLRPESDRAPQRRRSAALGARHVRLITGRRKSGEVIAARGAAAGQPTLTPGKLRDSERGDDRGADAGDEHVETELAPERAGSPAGV